LTADEELLDFLDAVAPIEWEEFKDEE